ncbi:MAG: hypothetical protein PWP45_970 [Tepidanaerobacteraceae bacterium]|nr:hypothetical protein [Tepidanaerobacteraceae bacterium]
MAHHAGVAELADATDLGSVGFPVEVQILSPAPKIFRQKASVFMPGYCFIIYFFML